jgi:hypothetical protein
MPAIAGMKSALVVSSLSPARVAQGPGDMAPLKSYFPALRTATLRHSALDSC